LVDTAGPITGGQRNVYDPSNARFNGFLTGNDLNSLGYTAALYYDGGGNVRDVVYYNSTHSGWNGNEDWLSFTRDGSGRITNEYVNRIDTNTTFDSDQVTYSQSGRIVDESIDGTDANSSGRNFTYDAAGRLTDAYVSGHHMQYSFANNPNCVPVSGLANAGANTNRTNVYDNGVMIENLCYDNADRLGWSLDSKYSGSVYDSHGNTTSMGGNSMTYDMENRHTGTTSSGSTVTYTRDATDRIVERKVNGTTVARYGYAGPGDSSGATLNASNVVQQKTIAMPGGAIVTKQASGDVWGYPNIHGDVFVVANAAGVKQGSTYNYDSFGQPLNGTPDNEQGNADYGWLGGKQRQTEHEGSLNTIEMGVRQYVAGLGRFLSMDPVEDGCANTYTYVHGDPLSTSDLSGKKQCMGPPPNKKVATWSLYGYGRGFGETTLRMDTGLILRVTVTQISNHKSDYSFNDSLSKHLQWAHLAGGGQSATKTFQNSGVRGTRTIKIEAQDDWAYQWTSTDQLVIYDVKVEKQTGWSYVPDWNYCNGKK
jgi:RHS repeat-associated protein